MPKKEFIKKFKGITSEDLVLFKKDFARAMMFICIKSRNNDFIYSSDLSEFLKVSTSRANQILNDLRERGLLKLNKKSRREINKWKRKLKK